MRGDLTVPCETIEREQAAGDAQDQPKDCEGRALLISLLELVVCLFFVHRERRVSKRAIPAHSVPCARHHVGGVRRATLEGFQEELRPVT